MVNKGIEIPDTYREYFLSLVSKDIIDESNASVLAKGVGLRNVLAHQYLDIRWQRIEGFIKADWKIYEVFLAAMKRYLIER